MAKFTSFTDIGVFRNIIRDITNTCRYEGKDENGDPIYNPSKPLPTLKFVGTTKLHGTNAAVCLLGNELWVQSRKRIITVEKDNAGFAQFANVRESSFRKMLEEIRERFNATENDIITVYGEWCGANIQSGVAISKLKEKMFVIFAVKISTKVDGNDYEGKYYPCDDVLRFPDEKIYNIMDYPKFEIDVDFSNPGKAQNEIVELVEKVEEECPVGKSFGVSGIGEGIVFTTYYNNNCFRFKAKGEKHSVTKVKKLAKVDPEVLKNIEEFVEYAVTENRMKQGMQEVFGEEEPSMKKTGQLIGWIMKDIAKEEIDTLDANNLTMKHISKKAANKVRQYLELVLNKNQGIN